MTDISIKVENITKRYAIGAHKKFPTLRDKLLDLVYYPYQLFTGTFPKKNEIFTALDHISFEVKKGEILGIIGRNGAGKSTLLKILSRITEPNSGKIIMKGRVASMLEVGTGFNMELTGRENIYLNGAIIGMTRKEINEQFNNIVEFAGVGKFLDTPVKHYSSGMYVRLAFAVAAHLHADILLIDEVLAVGDTDFQKKCLGKIGSISRSGKTIIFVSHNLDSVSNICTTCILLEKGVIKNQGPTDKVIPYYLARNRSNSQSILKDAKRTGNGHAKFTKVTLRSNEGKTTSIIPEKSPFYIELTLTVKEKINPEIISITFVNESGQDLLTTFAHDNLEKQALKPGVYKYNVALPVNPFIPGFINLRLACFGKNFLEYEHIQEAYSFEVVPAKGIKESVYRPGIIKIPITWNTTK